MIKNKNKLKYSYQDRIALVGLWYDYTTGMNKKFNLCFYPFDESFEIKGATGECFMRRMVIPEVKEKDMYVGNIINVNGRAIQLTGYANKVTERYLAFTQQQAICIIRPEAMGSKAKIIRTLLDNEFNFKKLKMMKFSPNIVKLLSLDGTTSFAETLENEPVLVMELVGRDGVKKLIELAGPEDPNVAKDKHPTSLRAMYGKSRKKNGVYVAQNAEETAKIVGILFDNISKKDKLDGATWVKSNSALCLIKPHILKEGRHVDIIQEIEDNGFSITALEMFYLDKVNAEDFFEVYRGVVPYYADVIFEMISGYCLALQIHKDDPEVYSKFKELVGPTDPQLAKYVKPKSLRALFGEDKIKNAVHFTDLFEDKDLEVEFFFEIMTE